MVRLKERCDMGRLNADGKRILIVEDEPGISMVCTRTLAADGFQVDVAANGRVALDMLRKKEYKLCLIDIRTPDMNGIELYQRLKEERPQMLDNVVFTTGDVLSGNIKVLLEESGRPYLPKPFTPDELRRMARDILYTREVQDAAGLKR
jgi:DNA-binding response OmpR family regulator